MKSQDKPDPAVLERNVSTLLEAGGEAPKLSDGARARIRAQLVEKHGTHEARKRSPLLPIGLGLAATAAGALIVTRVTGGDTEQSIEQTADDATWIARDGAIVTKLGPRRLRVE